MLAVADGQPGLLGRLDLLYAAAHGDTYFYRDADRNEDVHRDVDAHGDLYAHGNTHLDAYRHADANRHAHQDTDFYADAHGNGQPHPFAHAHGDEHGRARAEEALPAADREGLGRPRCFLCPHDWRRIECRWTLSQYAWDELICFNMF